MRQICENPFTDILRAEKASGTCSSHLDEDLSIHDGEFNKGMTVVGTSHLGAGKLQSLTPETYTFDVIENMFCEPVCSRVDAIDGICHFTVNIPSSTKNKLVSVLTFATIIL